MDNNNLFTFISNISYIPSVTLFDKSIFVHYKKVGTRYISGIASYPYNESGDSLQIELFFQSHLYSGGNPFTSMNFENYSVKGSIGQYYVYTTFDMSCDRDVIDKFKKFTSSKEFLEYSGVNNFTEFCFENPKELYFVIKNPIDRFLSGVIQVLLTAGYDLIFDEKTCDEIKFYTKISDRDLKDAIKIFQNSNSQVSELEKIPNKILFPIMYYFLEKRWDLLFVDVHTENYLNYINRWIYDIKNKNKIKIIDISQFSTTKAKNLINNLRTDFLETDGFSNIESFKSSNKKIYEEFISNYKSTNFSFYNYLKPEIHIYQQLINSPYFVDLKD
jgi:hypothetical protein